MKVFLSSTAQDLDAHRKIVEETILHLKQQLVAMEYFGALPGTPVEECERLARDSDVVVCIVAHRFGSGITRLEVEAAHKAGKDVLVWIVADDHPWTHMREETQLADPNVFSDPAKADEVRQRVQALFDFKAWLQKTFTVDRFTTPDDLGRKIAVALTNYIKGHAAPPIPQDRISIARLPVTSAELFGREAELKFLDEAWQSPNRNIVSFVAWGGVGKTALINHWLKRRMARDNYRGAERVLGWSFFSQGTRERAASADVFIDWALRWFGDSDPTAGSPWDKGERLARYIRQSRTLLILDGLEPLQHPPGPQEGRLKEAALQALLVELAAYQSGLCVISTRERIGDLVEFQEGTVIQHDLEHLSAEAGAQVLSSLGVQGSDEELEEAGRELGGHAFSLTLMGSYLNEVLDGDVRRRKEIENLFDDTRYGYAAQQMIAAYEKWLGEGIELAILRLLGLFDRPADLASIVALREPPVIVQLTEPLQHFKGRQWNQALSKLRRIKLLGEVSLDEPGTLDAHPLVREYFKQQMKRDRIKAWRAGNKRLYQHLKNTAKQFPNTVEEMSPLFAAVAHGCAASRYREVLNEVFIARIQRGNHPFSIMKLGAFSANLAALVGFFELPWQHPVAELQSMEKGFLLNAAGFCLRSVGRLNEAAESMRTALEIAIAERSEKNAARVANNLSELYLFSGKVPEALEFGRKGIDLADRSREKREQSGSRAILGDALHQAGQVKEALAVFHDAEKLHAEVDPQYPLLFSKWGFYYCDLLLALGQIEEVQKRAAYSLESVDPDLLSTSLDNLSLGRAHLKSIPSESGAVSGAADLLNIAVESLRRSGRITELPRGLLARAELYRVTQDFEKAARDLTEVQRIAARTNMGLYLADYYLESARHRLAQGRQAEAREHLDTAKEMINRMGYHRRDKEVAELEAQLA